MNLVAHITIRMIIHIHIYIYDSRHSKSHRQYDNSYSHDSCKKESRRLYDNSYEDLYDLDEHMITNQNINHNPILLLLLLMTTVKHMQIHHMQKEIHSHTRLKWILALALNFVNAIEIGLRIG